MPVELIQRWWLPFLICFAVAWYIFGFASYRVQQDARKRGLGRAAVIFWSVSVFFFGPIFLPLYLIFRSRAVFAVEPGKESEYEHFRLCPHCGEKNPDRERVCKACHKIMDMPVAMVGEKDCPYCSAKNPVEARRCKSCDQIIGYIESEND